MCIIYYNFQMTSKQSEAFHLEDRQPQTASDESPNGNITLHVFDDTKNVVRSENTYRMQPLVKIEVFIICFYECHKNTHCNTENICLNIVKMDNWHVFTQFASL